MRNDSLICIFKIDGDANMTCKEGFVQDHCMPPAV